MSNGPRFRLWLCFVLTALSLSLGWGIRGNFGHEYGAMIPGALASMAAVLTSGRRDWYPRLVYFALYGALGWSFGGSMSYMQVVAYTHSGHSLSALYGFACLFVIGFLWAALGGAGTALPALVDHMFLSKLIVPLASVFLLWWLQGAAIEPFLRLHGVSLYWYDTDWLAASLALCAVAIVVACRRGLDSPTALIFHLAAGWWAGFLILVLGLHLRMTPPRGDNWAGCLGMTVGLLVYCRTWGPRELARPAIICGFTGGIGFAAASMLKLVEVKSGYETNWHSILEQTTGLFNGVGLAAAVLGLAKWSPRIPDHDESAPAAELARPLALGFVLLGITYLNLRKNVAQWVAAGAVPAEMAGKSASGWFDLGYLALALALLLLVIGHRRRPLPILPATELGTGQLLYLGLLWWLTIGNFERALVAFKAQRLVTEGVIYLVALFCTLLLLIFSDSVQPAAGLAMGAPNARRPLRLTTACAVGIAAAALSIVADWLVVRAIYGDQFAGHARLHIRFGPDATITPRPGNP